MTKCICDKRQNRQNSDEQNTNTTKGEYLHNAYIGRCHYDKTQT